MSAILVIVESPDLGADLVRRAAALGGDVRSVALPEGTRPEDTVPELEAAVRDSGCALVLLAATVPGREIAARLATRLDAALVPEATSLQLTETGGRAERTVYAGGAVSSLEWEGLGVVSVAPHAGDPVDEGGAAAPTTPVVAGSDTRVVRTGLERRPPTGPDLQDARRIVCVGMGLRQHSDLELVERLAQALDAQVACTRPVSEDREWLPTERYIGISGLHLSPALYLGLGVSGQVQHAVGMRGATVVAVVNTDADCPAMQDADHQVVADLHDILPALVERLTSGARR